MRMTRQAQILRKTFEMIKSGRFTITTKVAANYSTELWDDAHGFAKELYAKMHNLRTKVIKVAYDEYYAVNRKPNIDQFIKYLMKWMIRRLDERGKMSQAVKMCVTYEIDYHIS